MADTNEKTGKTSQEKTVTDVSEFLQAIEGLYSSSFFIFLSDVGKNFRHFFFKNSQIFSAVSLVFKAIDFILYSIRFATAANPNLGKAVNLGVKFGSLILTAFTTLAAIVGITIGVLGSIVFFSLSLGFDLLYNLGRAIYFGIKSERTSDPKKARFFREEAKTYAKGVIIAGIVMMAVIALTLAAPYLALPAIAVIGLTIGIAITVLIVASFIQAIYKSVSNKKPGVVINNDISNDNEYDNSPQSDRGFIGRITAGFTAVTSFIGSFFPGKSSEKASEVSSPNLLNDDNTIIKNVEIVTQIPIINSQSKNTDYFENTITPPLLSMDKIFDKIKSCELKIIGEVYEKKHNYAPSFINNFWSQKNKRKDKLKALSFIKLIMESIKNPKKIITDDNQNAIEIKIKFFMDNPFFELNLSNQNKKEFIQKMNEVILKKWPEAYYSFNKDVGEVQACVNEVAKYIENDENIFSSELSKKQEI